MKIPDFISIANLFDFLSASVKSHKILSTADESNKFLVLTNVRLWNKREDFCRLNPRRMELFFGLWSFFRCKQSQLWLKNTTINLVSLREKAVYSVLVLLFELFHQHLFLLCQNK